MRALLLPAFGVLVTVAGIAHSAARQNPAAAVPAANEANGLQIAWAGFVYSSYNVNIYDIFGGGCPTPDYLPGKLGIGIHNGDRTQMAEGVRVRITLHDASGGTIDEETRTIPQVLAGEERAAVFSVLIPKARGRITDADAEIISIDTLRPGVPLAMPETRVSQPTALSGDPTRPPQGQSPLSNPCNQPFTLNTVACTITNPTGSAFVDVTVVIVALDSRGKALGFGSTVVEYLAAGSRASCNVSWSGPILRVAPVKAYANYPWNNPLPLELPDAH
jgi:hypothetical protein